MIDRTESVTRRRFLGLGGLVGVVGVAGCTGGGGTGGDGGGSGSGDGNGAEGSGNGGGSGEPSDPSYGGWLDNVPNYDGNPVDHTGTDSVSVTVGAGNGLLFEPPAIRVSPGTTVVWEWTGKGGQHNVQADDGAFESELATAEGTTFEHTFDDPGVFRYLCLPHQSVGMKGVVDVVEG